MEDGTEFDRTPSKLRVNTFIFSRWHHARLTEKYIEEEARTKNFEEVEHFLRLAIADYLELPIHLFVDELRPFDGDYEFRDDRDNWKWMASFVRDFSLPVDVTQYISLSMLNRSDEEENLENFSKCLDGFRDELKLKAGSDF